MFAHVHPPTTSLSLIDDDILPSSILIYSLSSKNKLDMVCICII